MDLFTIQNLHQDFLRSLIFIDDAKNHILSGGLDKTVKFIDLNEKKHHNLLNSEYEVDNLTLLNANQFIISGSTRMQVWDLWKMNESLCDKMIANKSISCIKVIGGKILTSSYDQHLKIFDSTDFGMHHQIKYDSPVVCFSANDNLRLFSISFQNNSLKVFQKHEDEIDEEEEIDPDMKIQREIMKKLYYGVGNKDESSYKYF